MRKILILLLGVGFMCTGVYAQKKLNFEEPDDIRYQSKLKVYNDIKDDIKMIDNLDELSQEEKIEFLRKVNGEKNKMRQLSKDKTKLIHQSKGEVSEEIADPIHFGKPRTDFAEQKAIREKIAKRNTQRKMQKTTKEAVEKQHLKSIAASNYLCGKMLDTVINYSWYDAQWNMISMTIYVFNDYGKITGETEYDYNADSTKWINNNQYVYTYDGNQNMLIDAYSEWDVDSAKWDNVEKYEYTYDANGNMLTETYMTWDGSAWLNVEKYTYTYDANGYMASELYEEWDGAEWDFIAYTSYEFTSNGKLLKEDWCFQGDDEEFYSFLHYTYDLNGWDVNETEFDDGLAAQYFERDGFNSGTGNFATGFKEIFSYRPINHYYMDESVEHGDMLWSYTYQEWDSIQEDWINIERSTNIEYDEYANIVEITYQDSSGASDWVNRERRTYEYFTFYDCNDEIIAFTWDYNLREIWDGIQWLTYYLEENILEQRATDSAYYLDPIQYYYLIWNEDSAKFTGHDGYYYEIYTYQGGSLVQYEQKDWDVASQEWINYYVEVEHDDTAYSAQWTGSEWAYYDLSMYFYDETEGYLVKYLELVGDGVSAILDSSYQELYAYNANGAIISYTEQQWSGSAWINDYRELYQYNEAGWDSVLTSQWWDGAAWLNDEQVIISYQGAISYTEVYQLWDADSVKWLNSELIVWGDDWDKWAVWDFDDNDWLYTEWWFDQDFTWYPYVNPGEPGYPQGYTAGLKLWDDVDEEWEYQFFEVWDYYHSGGWFPFNLYYYLLQLPNNEDGEFLVNEYQKTRDYVELKPANWPQYSYLYEEWSKSNSQWIAKEKWDKEYIVEDCALTWTSEEAYEWDDANGIWLRTDGFESDTKYEEFGDDSLLVESWYKEWNSGVLTGNRSLYNYTSDGYMLSSIYQTWSSGAWENSIKTEYTWSGIADLTIWNGEVTDVDCYGENTGEINIDVRGGTQPYTFSWTNGAITEDLEDIFAGIYAVTITDANGCIYQSEYVNVEQNLQLTAGFVIQGASTMHNVQDPGIDGWATVNPSGGMPPYSYLWSNPAGATTATMTDVKEGTYTVTVTDALACSRVFSVYIPGDGSYTGMEQITFEVARFYPNPSNGNITLELTSQFSNAKIAIYDTKGQVVFTSTIAGAIRDGYSKEINLNTLAEGIYVIRVVGDKESFTSRLLLKK